MWRFLANVIDPNDSKDKQNKAKDRKEEYKEYESKKRSRSISDCLGIGIHVAAVQIVRM